MLKRSKTEVNPHHPVRDVSSLTLTNPLDNNFHQPLVGQREMLQVPTQRTIEGRKWKSLTLFDRQQQIVKQKDFTAKPLKKIDNIKRKIGSTLDVWKKFSVAKNFPLSLGINVDPIEQCLYEHSSTVHVKRTPTITLLTVTNDFHQTKYKVGKIINIPLPFCSNFREADLHSEKLPLGCRSGEYLLFSNIELGERPSDNLSYLYPRGVQGSICFFV